MIKAMKSSKNYSKEVTKKHSKKNVPYKRIKSNRFNAYKYEDSYDNFFNK